MTVRIPGTGKVSLAANGRMRVGPTFTPVNAVGGAEAEIKIDNVVYKVHTFTSTGILTVTSAVNDIAPVEYLVVAGGGGGGFPSSPTRTPGGGGAGGFRTGIINLNLDTYVINVGAGGAADSVGENSFIGFSPTGPYIISSNGGGSGGRTALSGSSGGSGGGGGGAPSFIGGGLGGPGIPGQGFAGGDGQPGPSLGPTGPLGGFGGGGGGAGGAGGGWGSPNLGTGGLGIYNSISGENIYYSYGGNSGGGSPGPDNSGVGGGGGENSGGSGIVIIRYRIA